MSEPLNSGTEAALDAIDHEAGTQTSDVEARNDAGAAEMPAGAAQPASSNAGNATMNADRNDNKVGDEKRYTEQELQQKIAARIAVEKAKNQQPNPKGAEDDVSNIGETITVSRDALESMVRDELTKNQQEATFMRQVNTLNTALLEARQDDESFNAACEAIPQDVAQKFYAVFAGQEDAVTLIKTILHDKALSKAFIDCSDPMQMSHILGRAHSAAQQGQQKASGYKTTLSLKNTGAKQSADSLQSDAPVDAYESVLYD